MNQAKIMFKSPTVLALENGVSAQLGLYLKKLGVTRALLVTDSVILELGTADRIRKAAESWGVKIEVYSHVLPEPPVENVEEALSMYRETGCDGVVGLGGGSAIDVAKAAAMLVTNEGGYERYVGIDQVKNRCAPLILMPTTSGTGSEVSVFSIMLLNGSKAGVVDQNITAHAALVDPLLTLSVPRTVTAATGLDALCHHLESFLSVNSSPFCDAICLEGIRAVSRWLPKAAAMGDNKEARYWMSYASTLGGYVMNLTDGAAANHGLAFALGALFHVGHGLSNAVMLPHVFPVIARAELEKTRQIGEAMGIELGGLSQRECLDKVTASIAGLAEDLDCRIPLCQFGVKEQDLDRLVQETNTQTRVMNHSTYQLSSSEIREIFRRAL